MTPEQRVQAVQELMQKLGVEIKCFPVTIPSGIEFRLGAMASLVAEPPSIPTTEAEPTT